MSSEYLLIKLCWKRWSVIKGRVGYITNSGPRNCYGMVWPSNSGDFLYSHDEQTFAHW